MYQFKVNLNKYPELKKLKKVEVKNTIETIIDIGYKMMYPDLSKVNSDENLIISKLEKLEKNTPTISELNKSITQLLGVTNNSSRKGELVEGIVEEYLISKYSSNSYQVKRSEPHCGDGWLTLPNKKKVMVEVKAYSKTVGEQEVKKLRNDMKYNQINLSVMISLGTKIQNSKMVDLEVFTFNNKPYYIIKLGPISNNKEILDIGFCLIENISNIISNNLKKVIMEDNLLEKTSLLLEKINFNHQLRQNYQNMSMEIYQKMDNFNQDMLKIFIEQENLIREIVKEISENSIHQINLTEKTNKKISDFENYKIYPNLIKVVEFLDNINIEWSIDKGKIISKKLEIKISQEKLTIILLNQKINLVITSKSSDVKSNQLNLKLINQLLN